MLNLLYVEFELPLPSAVALPKPRNLPTRCVCVFSVAVTINNDYYCTQLWKAAFLWLTVIVALWVGNFICNLGECWMNLECVALGCSIIAWRLYQVSWKSRMWFGRWNGDTSHTDLQRLLVFPFKEGSKINVGLDRVRGYWLHQSRVRGYWLEQNMVRGYWLHQNMVTGYWLHQSRVRGYWLDQNRVRGCWLDQSRDLACWLDQNSEEWRTLVNAAVYFRFP